MFIKKISPFASSNSFCQCLHCSLSSAYHRIEIELNTYESMFYFERKLCLVNFHIFFNLNIDWRLCFNYKFCFGLFSFAKIVSEVMITYILIRFLLVIFWEQLRVDYFIFIFTERERRYHSFYQLKALNKISSTKKLQFSVVFHNIVWSGFYFKLER